MNATKRHLKKIRKAIKRGVNIPLSQEHLYLFGYESSENLWAKIQNHLDLYDVMHFCLRVLKEEEYKNKESRLPVWGSAFL
jgi:hypothetical protein